VKKLTINHQGEDIEVWAQKISGRLWLHYHGETHVYEPQGSLSKNAAGAKGDPNLIQAPMPGKIIKVLKKQGDLVKSGDTIVVMEAMKMEYNLKAVEERTITAVLCKENQTVSAGQKLVELKEDLDG
jgi:biotin carboxyl carrier protein